MKLRVAAAQVEVSSDVAKNVSTIIRAIQYALSAKADILLTPEGSLSGYTHEFAPCLVEEGLRQVVSTAQANHLGLALGTCFIEADGKCYNQVRFYLPDGEYLGFHSKTLRCGTMEDVPKGEINHYACTPLRTFDYAGVRVGALICNDLWANPQCTPVPDPHLTQQLSKMGARIIFHAVNGGRDGSEWSRLAWQYHESNLRMRAQAGKLWIITVDNCAPVSIPCSAPSGVIDPQGSWVYRTDPQGERFFAHTIEIPDCVCPADTPA